MLSRVKNVLVVEPHADDLVIGCGGLVAKLVEENKANIFSVLLSPSPSVYRKIKGDQGEYETYGWEQRFAELQEAMHELGFHDVEIPWLDAAEDVHHRLDMMSQSELISMLEKHVRRSKPDLVLIPERSYNQDHRAIYDAFMTVARPHFYSGIVLAYETTMEREFEPTFLVELTNDQWQKKMNACGKYKTQLGKSEHLFSMDTIDITAQYRGRLIYSKYAEAYRLVRGVFK